MSTFACWKCGKKRQERFAPFCEPCANEFWNNAEQKQKEKEMWINLTRAIKGLSK